MSMPPEQGVGGRSRTRTCDRSEITEYPPGSTDGGLTSDGPGSRFTDIHHVSLVISDAKVTRDLDRVSPLHFLNWRVISLAVASWVALAVVVLVVVEVVWP